MQIMKSLWEKKAASTRKDFTREVDAFKGYLGTNLPTKAQFMGYFTENQSNPRFHNSGVCIVHAWGLYLWCHTCRMGD